MITLDEAGRDLARTILQPPPADLASVVEYLWVEAAPGLGSTRCRVVADPSAHLIYTARSRGQAGTLRLVGARSVFIDIDKAYRVLTVGVRFVPGALRGLFGIAARDLVDRSVDLEAVVGASAARLVGRLAESEDGVDVADHVLAFLRGRVGAAAAGDWRVDVARQLLASSDRSPALADLAAATGNAPRTLRRVVRAEVGLGWRRWSRIHRLSGLLHRALGASTPRWAELAVACGYFDQAHLIRDHGQLLGETPAQYLRRALRAGDGAVSSNPRPSRCQ